MVINSNTYSQFTKLSLLDHKNITLGNTLTNEQLCLIIDMVFKFESETEHASIAINFEKLELQQVISIFKHVMMLDQFETIRNASIILNMLMLLRPYNTFDQSFFDSNLIIFSDIEQFLDVKSELCSEIKNLAIQISQCFMSLCKSMPKIEYSVLDDYVKVPNFYASVFQTIDLTALFGIMSQLDCDVKFKLTKYADANIYIDSIIEKYQFSISLMNRLLSEHALQGG